MVRVDGSRGVWEGFVAGTWLGIMRLIGIMGLMGLAWEES